MYRSLYNEFLKQDSPKIPIPDDQEYFDKYVAAGKRLIELHLAKADVQKELYLNVTESHNLLIDQVKFISGKVFINKEMTNTFDMVNFKSMWQFCQFVRFAEKVFNYINRPERKLYVDSDMNDLSKRSFKISTDDKTMDIFCFLEKVNEPINKKNICVIRLKIQRKYGKQMMNEFTIVDDFVKSKDTSDSMLIDNIFNLIATEMKDTFSSIISKAVFIAEERKKNEKGSDSNE